MNKINDIAVVFGLICEKFDSGKLGKKVVQKMFYLIERSGVPLNLRYGIHFYGPYSSVLDNVMHVLESDDIINIDTSGMTHKISLGKEKVTDSTLSNEEYSKINFVLENFSNKSPMELEAITTLDYVATTLLNSSATDEQIIDGVKEIKGDKFSREDLQIHLDTLKQFKYL